ncbi:MAG: hypothetical protein RI935_283 [Candidatus Parcubacteria bacterium]|jgi:hypothetical protein
MKARNPLLDVVITTSFSALTFFLLLKIKLFDDSVGNFVVWLHILYLLVFIIVVIDNKFRVRDMNGKLSTKIKELFFRSEDFFDENNAIFYSFARLLYTPLVFLPFGITLIFFCSLIDGLCRYIKTGQWKESV